MSLVIFWTTKDVLVIKCRFYFLRRELYEIFLIYIVIFFRNGRLKSQRKRSISSSIHISLRLRLLLLRIILACHLSIIACHTRQAHLIVVYVIFGCENVKWSPLRFESWKVHLTVFVGRRAWSLGELASIWGCCQKWHFTWQWQKRFLFTVVQFEIQFWGANVSWFDREHFMATICANLLQLFLQIKSSLTNALRLLNCV